MVSLSDQQCQSNEGGWLVIQTALNVTRLTSPDNTTYNNTIMLHHLMMSIHVRGI